MELSKQSKDFLENLRLYLITSGKSAGEVEDVIDELKDHLYEAEKKGKNVQDIIGKTPKDYMKSIAKEMPFDSKDFFKYVTVFILAAFAFLVLNNALNGGLTYSLLVLIGYLFIYLLFLFMVAFVYKYVASSQLSKRKEAFTYIVTGCMPIILFIVLQLLNEHYRTPLIHIGIIGPVATIVVAYLIFIGLSIWSKTWILVIISIIYLPKILISNTGLDQKAKITLFLIIFIVGFAAYMIIKILRIKKRKKLK